jgi:hypothetical protein
MDHATGTTPDLPTLQEQWYLLETDGRPTGPLQSLVLDHLLLHDGPVYWVDAAGHARSDALARLAPSERLLERVRVARGFTAHQHAALVERVADLVDGDTAMLVLPAVDATYRGDDLRGASAEAMLRTTAERVAAIRREHDVPVVATCQRRDDLTAPVAERVEATVRCESTQFGPRFVGADFETLVYDAGGGYVQTTLAFWRRVLEARADARAGTAEPTAPLEVPVRGAD